MVCQFLNISELKETFESLSLTFSEFISCSSNNPGKKVSTIICSNKKNFSIVDIQRHKIILAGEGLLFLLQDLKNSDIIIEPIFRPPMSH